MELELSAAALIFGFLIATAYGSAFHVMVGGSVRHIPIYLVASWVGFALGHLVGQAMGLDWLKLGVVYFFSASLGSWLALIVSRFIVQNNREEPSA